MPIPVQLQYMYARMGKWEVANTATTLLCGATAAKHNMAAH